LQFEILCWGDWKELGAAIVYLALSSAREPPDLSRFAVLTILMLLSATLICPNLPVKFSPRQFFELAGLLSFRATFLR